MGGPIVAEGRSPPLGDVSSSAWERPPATLPPVSISVSALIAASSVRHRKGLSFIPSRRGKRRVKSVIDDLARRTGFEASEVRRRAPTHDLDPGDRAPLHRQRRTLRATRRRRRPTHRFGKALAPDNLMGFKKPQAFAGRRHAQFRRPLRARNAGPRDQQRGGGRPHLRRFRRRSRRQLPDQRAGVQGNGGRGKRTPPPADRSLVTKYGDHIPLVRRHDIRGYIPQKPIWQLRPLGMETVRSRAREMERAAARFYRRR